MKPTRIDIHGKPYRWTMTVGELIAKLQEFPADMAVLPAWEGFHTQIEPEGFTVFDYQGLQCLEIYVDDYCLGEYL